MADYTLPMTDPKNPFYQDPQKKSKPKKGKCGETTTVIPGKHKKRKKKKHKKVDWRHPNPELATGRAGPNGYSPSMVRSSNLIAAQEARQNRLNPQTGMSLEEKIAFVLRR